METKLFVGNLSYSTSEDELRELFAQAGTVSSVTLIKERETGRSKGFAFVEMSSREEAEKAINMFNNSLLGDRALKVDIARPREERPSGGYGQRSGGGYGQRSGGYGNRSGSGGNNWGKSDRDRRSGGGNRSKGY
jgi:RNA recognition motif-containing protein